MLSSIGLIAVATKAFFINERQNNIFIATVCLIISIELIYFVYLNWIYFFDRNNITKIVQKFLKKEDKYEQRRN